MGDIDKFMRLLRRQIRAVDREIVSCVRAQSSRTAAGRAAAGAAAAAAATTTTTAPTSPRGSPAAATGVVDATNTTTTNDVKEDDDDDLAAAEARAAELASHVAAVQRRALDAECLVQAGILLHRCDWRAHQLCCRKHLGVNIQR